MLRAGLAGLLSCHVGAHVSGLFLGKGFALGLCRDEHRLCPQPRSALRTATTAAAAAAASTAVYATVATATATATADATADAKS